MMNKCFPMTVLGAFLALSIPANAQSPDPLPIQELPDGAVLVWPAQPDAHQFPEELLPSENTSELVGYSAFRLMRSSDSDSIVLEEIQEANIAAIFANSNIIKYIPKAFDFGCAGWLAWRSN